MRRGRSGRRVRRQGLRHEQVGAIERGQLEIGRQNAYDQGRQAVDLDVLAHGSGGGAEAVFPQGVRNNDNAWRARAILFRVEVAAQQRLNVEHRQECGFDAGAGQTGRAVAGPIAIRHAGPGGDGGEGARFAA